MLVFKKVKFAILTLMSTALVFTSLFPAAAAWTQRGSGAGTVQGSAITGGAYTKGCPSGYVVTGVAVANAESFGYTEGFQFFCTEVLPNGTLGTTTTSITQVTNKPSNSQSLCPTGYALIGVQTQLRWDPNNNANYYVNDLGATCAKFTDRSVFELVPMARNVKVGPANEYKDLASNCPAGFTVGFTGRSGAGLDSTGVLCATFDEDAKPIANSSFLIGTAGPKISQNAESITCQSGEYVFMRLDSTAEKSSVTDRIVQLMRGENLVATLTVKEGLPAVFNKPKESGTYWCNEKARQGQQIGEITSKSRTAKTSELGKAYRENLLKNAENKRAADKASQDVFYSALSAATLKAEKAISQLTSTGANRLSDLKKISAIRVEEIAKATSNLAVSRAKNLVGLGQANQLSYDAWQKAIEDAGISVRIS